MRIFQWSATGILLILLSSSLASAQQTPLQVSINGSTVDSYDATSKDILGEAIKQHNDSKKSSGTSISTFSMGRLRETNHDGYKSSFRDKSLPFTSSEYSLFGALGYNFNKPNGRLSVHAFAGITEIDMDLKASPELGFNTKPGSAQNEAVMAGTTIVYSSGAMYGGFKGSYFAGKTDVNDIANNRRPSYDTEGFILSGMMGRVSELNKNTFLTTEIGTRYIHFNNDGYASNSRNFNVVHDLYTLTGWSSLKLIKVYNMNGWTVRPYGAMQVSFDFRYDHSEVVEGAGEDPATAEREPVQGRLELGASTSKGNWDISGAGFFDVAEDHEAYGGRVGVSYKLK